MRINKKAYAQLVKLINAGVEYKEAERAISYKFMLTKWELYDIKLRYYRIK